MSDYSTVWIRDAGTLSLAVEWRPANDFDLAGLSCWRAFHPDKAEQPLYIATFTDQGANSQNTLTAQAIELIRRLNGKHAGSLLYLHSGLAKDCKSALLPNLVWQAGHFNEVLGLKTDCGQIGWPELQLAASMAQQSGGCILLLDKLSRFSFTPQAEISRLTYLYITDENSVCTESGWCWRITNQPADKPLSLTNWLEAPEDGDILLQNISEHQPLVVASCRYDTESGAKCR